MNIFRFTCRNPICFCDHIAFKFQKNGNWHIWQLSLSNHFGVSWRFTFKGQTPRRPSAEHVTNNRFVLSNAMPTKRSECPFNSKARPWWAPTSQTTVDVSKLPENNQPESGSHRRVWTPPWIWFNQCWKSILFEEKKINYRQNRPVWPESVVINWNRLSGLILRNEIFPFESPTKHCRDSSSSANDIAQAGKR